jgi:PPM family protein phosphatase
MLRIAEEAFRSDVGRQRSANEDSYFARAPLFAVADGMGGAQAGEVASRIAAESFAPDEGWEGSPESYLRSIAQGANERIHRLAQADSTRSGMGTTLTAALLDGDEVSLAHVGDSRAYRFRDGQLKLLTSDHSLVEELRRQGRLTDEQAEDHPQRSIITRALGPEPDVVVDTMTYRARPGDVYLLCSDGLTTMVREARIAAILAEADDLDAAVERLVEEANSAGGRDNITVVAFRLEEAEVAVAAADGATLVGPSSEEAGLSAAALRSAERQEARRRAALGGAAAAPPAKPRRRRRRALVAAAAVLVVAGVAAAAVWGLHQVYFLGSDSAGRLALYRGLPYELPLGLKLYSEEYAAPVQVANLPANERSSATDHELRSKADATSLVKHLTTVARPPRLPAPLPVLPKPKPKPSGGRAGGGGPQSAVRSPQSGGGGGTKQAGQTTTTGGGKAGGGK